MAALGDDLLGVVNKLQDLVFNTIGNDSLDLPQIVRNNRPPPSSFRSTPATSPCPNLPNAPVPICPVVLLFPSFSATRMLTILALHDRLSLDPSPLESRPSSRTLLVATFCPAAVESLLEGPSFFSSSMSLPTTRPKM